MKLLKFEKVDLAQSALDRIFVEILADPSDKFLQEILETLETALSEYDDYYYNQAHMHIFQALAIIKYTRKQE